MIARIRDILTAKPWMKFFLRGFLMLVILSLLVTFIGRYNVGLWNEPIDRSFDELEELVEEEDGPDVLYFSNSYLFTLLDPIYIESKTGLSSLHMGAPSLALPASLLHAEEALEMHKPKCVVFEVCPRSTGYPNTDSQWKFFSQAVMSRGVSTSSLEVLWGGREHWPSVETFFDGASLTTASYNHLNKVKHYDNVTWAAQNYRGYKPLFGGDWMLHNAFSDESYDSLYYNDNYRPAEREYFEWYGDQAFCDFLKRTTDQGTKVLLVETLKLDTWSKNGLDTIKEKLEGINPEMIQLVNWDTKEMKTRLGFRQADFYDKLHLRQPASLKFCELIAPDIQKFVGDPIGESDGELRISDDFTCRYSKLYASNRSAPVMHFYFDSIPKAYETWNVCLKVYPKGLFKDKLGDNSDCYTRFVSLNAAMELNNELCLDAPMYTLLKKDQIERVEFYLIGASGISESICVYEDAEKPMSIGSDEMKNAGTELYSLWAVVFCLPLLVLLYFVIPFRFRWMLLLLTSVCFLLVWEERLVIHLLVSVVSSYGASYLLSRWGNQKVRKLLLWAVISLNVFLLGTFMHLSNLTTGFVGVLEWLDLVNFRISKWTWLAPVGISFYTLQVIGHLIDVYRDKSKHASHFGLYALSVCYFPKMVSGPIENSNRLIEEFKKEYSFDAKRSRNALLSMLLGATKVWVVATTLQPFVDTVFQNPEMKSGPELILGSVSFAIQIYMTFSGFVNMGEGISLIFGIRLSRSFSSPFTATSSAAFWQRWNMSFHVWIKKYLYPFLKGFKYGAKDSWVIVMIVFVLSSLWYGSGFKVLLWGAFCGVVFIIEKYIRNNWTVSGKSSVLNGLITFSLFSFSLLFLKLGSVGAVLETMKRWMHLDLVNVFRGSLYDNGLTPSQLWGVLLLSGLIITGEYLQRVNTGLIKAFLERLGPLRWCLYLGCVVAFVLFRNVAISINSELFVF